MDDWSVVIAASLVSFITGFGLGKTYVETFKTSCRALLSVVFAHLDRKEYFSPYERAIIRESQKLLK